MEQKKNRLMVDYYFTKKSDRTGDYDNYDIVNKTKMKAYSSDGSTLGDNIDVFLHKNDFPSGTNPSHHDMVFFTNEKRFYEANNFEDAGDFYIVNVSIIKPKDK